MSDHLITHAYTVLEIERMRKALRSVIYPGGYSGRIGDDDKTIEIQLRTYMLNGTRPEELESIAEGRKTDAVRRWEAMEAALRRVHTQAAI